MIRTITTHVDSNVFHSSNDQTHFGLFKNRDASDTQLPSHISYKKKIKTTLKIYIPFTHSPSFIQIPITFPLSHT